MSRITDTLRNLKKEGRTGLIIYITAGAPDFATTLEAVRAAEAAGADIIELGIPFSDPMADGPVIQKAAMLALKAGTATAGIVELVQRIREESQIPLAAMTYMNSVLNFGQAEFAAAFRQAGLDGLIVPDLPLEESAGLEDICRDTGLNFIRFVAPTTDSRRVARICDKAGGFIYCVSTTGVTGIREVDYSGIGAVIEQVRQHTAVPAAIGFGIGTPAAAKAAAGYADAVIVGSAVMQRLMDGGVSAAGELIRSIRQALDER